MPPTAPTLIDPRGQHSAAGTFAFAFGAGGTAPTAWDLQITEDPTWATITGWDVAGQGSGITGMTVAAAYTGPELVVGRIYQWRARGRTTGAVGSWARPAMFGPDPRVVRGPYDSWAAALMSELAYPRTLTVLGTLLPVGAQVAQLLRVPFRGQLRIRDDEHPPSTDRHVEVIGMTMHVDHDGGWEVSAVTHDIEGG